MLTVSGDAVTFFHNGFAQVFARLVGLHLHPVLRSVNGDFSRRVEPLDGPRDGFVTVVAGHAGNFKNLFKALIHGDLLSFVEID
jgi:hypothetical protein